MLNQGSQLQRNLRGTQILSLRSLNEITNVSGTGIDTNSEIKYEWLGLMIFGGNMEVNSGRESGSVMLRRLNV